MKHSGIKTIDKIAEILLIIGGLNWGIIAISHVNLIVRLFNYNSALITFVFALVGLAALYRIIQWARVRFK